MTRWVTAALLSGALALTACEAEPAEPAEPSSSAPASSEPTSAAPTTEPTGPVEPTLPPEAEANTKAGAEAFVQYWWELVNYATATGDTAALRGVFGPACASCDAATSAIENVYANGGRITGRGYRIESSKIVSEPGGAWAITADLSVGRQAVRGAGELNQVYPAGTKSHVMFVEFVRERWQVATWTHD
ncbi:hypothetical protein HNR19_000634 [Nocardioides thalensis]|uniref:DUF6318 domain-containing protein n=1 Tax=Nocardioides thalensis TaxID=1914755 RepID=A0A853BYV8_9ACTN|nr:DUF6318 family protein [Nocardioides thalensis]NYI99935.1 hypothetical protein [Nocardioides thalensis]